MSDMTLVERVVLAEFRLAFKVADMGKSERRSFERYARAALAEVVAFLDEQPTTPSGDAYATAAELIRKGIGERSSAGSGE